MRTTGLTWIVLTTLIALIVPAVGVSPAGSAPGIVAQRVVAAGEKLNLDLRDAGLTDVLDALARLCGLNMVTDASVQGRVTLHLVGVTCEEALRFLLEANGLGFRRVGETLIVQGAAKLTPPPPVPVVRVYKLQYLQPPVSQPEPLVGSVGATTAGGAGISGGAGPLKKDVASLTDLFKGTGAQVGYDDRTNSLVVTGTPTQQEAVGELVRILDVPTPQVMVQAEVVDITVTSLKDLGIEWSVLQSSTGTPFTFQELGPPPAGQLGLQPIQRDALLARLHAFVSEGKARVLSDPRVATPDGQEALIFAGDQIPIVNTTSSGNPPVTAQTVTFQPVGVTLKIVPKILADRTVMVQIHPVVTTVTSNVVITVNGSPNTVPIIAIREAVTTLTVPDGGSLILGGLMKYSDIVNLKKIPFLSDLPFLGQLFQVTNVTHQESEVVILMTPRILSTGTPVVQ
jgi:type IV pilus assembly protein PilQ